MSSSTSTPGLAAEDGSAVAGAAAGAAVSGGAGPTPAVLPIGGGNDDGAEVAVIAWSRGAGRPAEAGATRASGIAMGRAGGAGDGDADAGVRDVLTTGAKPASATVGGSGGRSGGRSPDRGRPDGVPR